MAADSPVDPADVASPASSLDLSPLSVVAGAVPAAAAPVTAPASTPAATATRLARAGAVPAPATSTPAAQAGGRVPYSPMDWAESMEQPEEDAFGSPVGVVVAPPTPTTATAAATAASPASSLADSPLGVVAGAVVAPSPAAFGSPASSLDLSPMGVVAGATPAAAPPPAAAAAAVASPAMVGRCSFTLSKPTLKAPSPGPCN